MMTPLQLPKTLLERADLRRLAVSKQLNSKQRAEKGQFFTPLTVARLMASMLSPRKYVKILDAGAGVGSLVAAGVDEIFKWPTKPAKISVVAYEIEPLLFDLLQETMSEIQLACQSQHLDFEYKVYLQDFIEMATRQMPETLFSNTTQFAPNIAILNPPYHKIDSQSMTRQWLRLAGIETGNLYTAFLWLSAILLEPQGEMITITPRSFCNGPYFRPFRKTFFTTTHLTRIHTFSSRNRTFPEDEVLQENIILQVTKSTAQPLTINISASVDAQDDCLSLREVDYEQVIKPDDPEYFIHVIPDEISSQINQQAQGLPMNLSDLGISVSTGRVIDFRSKPFLSEQSSSDTVPLIYPHHLSKGRVNWPNGNRKKPEAIRVTPQTEELLVKSGHYVLVKRFSPKEENKRVVAAVFDPNQVPSAQIGFENHLNYFHFNGSGLHPCLAKGLSAFLNTTLIDQYFRHFNGHTQVNATDLRQLKYPTTLSLHAIGSQMGDRLPSQKELDNLVLQELNMIPSEFIFDPLRAKQRIAESLDILKALGMPREQQNERSALTLLALLNITVTTPWSGASAPLRGITEIMEFGRHHFGVEYAPNTRESFRRATIHQFVQTGLVVRNPDQPRPPNSPKTCYQIESTLLSLLQSYQGPKWSENLAVYLKTTESLRKLQSHERDMQLILVKLPHGEEVKLSSGGQNLLIKSIIEEFCPRFTPDGVVVYIGDAEQKIRGEELVYLGKIGVKIDKHGKMPDVIIHFKPKNWLIIIEAVTSHGPINIKRHNELKELFQNSQLGLVFVTAFESRKAMVKYLREIAWETEVWVADSPSHLIHFNGEKFLGPY